MKSVRRLALTVLLALTAAFSGPHGPSPDPASVALVTLPEYNRPIITAYYDGKPLRFIFDTGSTVTVLRPGVYQALGSPGDPLPPGSIAGLTGGILNVTRVSLTNLEIGHCKLLALPVWIAQINLGPEGDGGISGILGVDAMKHLGRIQFYPEQMKIETWRCG